MAAMSRNSTGRTIANSTADAPRSVLAMPDRPPQSCADSSIAPRHGRRTKSQICAATLLNVVDRLLPSSETAAMITTAIKATIRPYSTAVAPRSAASRLWILAASLVMKLSLVKGTTPELCESELVGPLHERVTGAKPYPRLRTRGRCSDLGGDVVERRRQVVAEQGDCGDDHDSDQSDHQAVLDSGRAALLVEQRLDLGSNLGHVEGFLPVMQGHPNVPPADRKSRRAPT